MSKFDFDNANQKNVFSGEDGILFVHQNENGDNCIEINSENFIDCIKDHIGSLIKNDFKPSKMWLKFNTPHGKLLFNIDDFAFMLSNMYAPFFTLEDKKRFNDIAEEYYEQITSLKDGHLIWGVIEARCNEDVWHGLDNIESESPDETNFVKFGKYLAKRIGNLKLDSSAMYEKSIEMYAEFNPNTAKAFTDLIEQGKIVDAIKPIVNILTLGIVSELIMNTSILEVITNFFSKHMGIFNTYTNWKDLMAKTGKFSLNTHDNQNREHNKEFNKRFRDIIGSAKDLSKEELKNRLDDLMKWDKANKVEELNSLKFNIKPVGESSKSETPKSENDLATFDYKSLKEKFVGEIDKILDKATTLSQEEFVETIKSYKDNFAKLFDLYQAKSDFDKEMEKVRKNKFL